MFEDVVSPGGAPAGRRRIAVGPVAVLLHALVLGGALASALLNGEDLSAPDPPVRIEFSPQPVTPPSPPPPLGGPRHTAGPSSPATAAPDPARPESAAEIPSPEAFDETQGAWSSADTGVGDPAGDPFGVEGGTGERGSVTGTGPGGGDRIHELTREITPPRLLHRVDPVYPETGRKLRLQGLVVVRAIIGLDGAIEEVSIARSLHPILDEAALAALRQWRYAPATLNGRAVRVALTVTVQFTLRS